MLFYFYSSLILFFLDSLQDKYDTQVTSKVLEKKKKDVIKFKSEHHITAGSPLTPIFFHCIFSGKNAG